MQPAPPWLGATTLKPARTASSADRLCTNDAATGEDFLGNVTSEFTWLQVNPDFCSS